MKYFKHILKKCPPVYALNAKLKASRLRQAYDALNKHYQTEALKQGILYRRQDVADMVEQRLRDHSINIESVSSGKLRILYVGTVPEQDFGGIIQGLKSFGQVIAFECEPGRYGQIPTAIAKDRAKRNGQNLTKQLQDALKSGPIHAVIGQMWANTMAPEALQQVRRRGVPVVNISMDDRHAFRGERTNERWTGTSGLIEAIDLACTTAEECCLWYLCEGCPAIYMPEASDSELYKPLSEAKQEDVCFVGGNYGIRSKIVKAIEKKGVKVTCYGAGWPNGKIDVDKMPELFAKSRIVLGVGTIGHCSDFYSLKMRDFDGPMSGSLYLTHDNPDLYSLYEIGKEIATYCTAEECANKVLYYLNHADERQAIANAGRERALREHTWERRFEQVFEVLGLTASTETKAVTLS